MRQFEAVAIGSSAGGLEALRMIFSALAAHFPLAVLVVQHEAATADGFIANYLQRFCALPVGLVDDKLAIQARHAYIAPPGYHLQVEPDRSFSLSVDLPVHFARPAIDILFETAAETYTSALIGVVLTGANADGSAGLYQIKARGGVTIAQDPASAEVPYMPAAAIAAAAPDYILPLAEIGHALNQLAMRGYYEKK